MIRIFYGRRRRKACGVPRAGCRCDVGRCARRVPEHNPVPTALHLWAAAMAGVCVCVGAIVYW